ncbi:MAG: hypothetical protein AB1306_01150 [Nitrospirota bacterium]
MTPTNKIKTDTKRRLAEASKRTAEIYKHVGCLSTHFAGLELTLLKLLMKMINPNEPNRAEKALSQMSFRQTVDAFRQTVAERILDSEAVKEAASLGERLLKAATNRNDIIHSSWLAYSTGDFCQHRARAKGKKRLENQIHTKNPVKHIEEVTDTIYALIFDLACFEDKIEKENVEQKIPADAG